MIGEMIGALLRAMRKLVARVRQALCDHGPWDCTTTFDDDGGSRVYQACRRCGHTEILERAAIQQVR